MIGRNEAIKDQNFAGCVASETLIGAFDSAGDALSTRMMGEVVIPGFEVNLQDCLVLTPSVETQEDAAVWVEAIAGVAISAGTHYATKLRMSDCTKGELALAAMSYLRNMVNPITDEIANTDGVLVIPAVTVDLSSCAEG
jgi:hypothetical protein